MFCFPEVPVNTLYPEVFEQIPSSTVVLVIYQKDKITIYNSAVQHSTRAIELSRP